MGKKISDSKIDALFEKMDRRTARLIDNQHEPKKKKTVAKSKKRVKK